MTYDLRQVPLFTGLPDEDLRRLSEGLTDCFLGPGQPLFHEGDEGDKAYVITKGELEILKQSAGRDVRIAVSTKGDVVGEMALLTSETRSATARALTAVELVSIPKKCLDEVLATSAAANRALFDVFIARWREQESRVRQSERMAQLGVLTAGLAHEMNNPAAAVSAGAQKLSDAIATRVDAASVVPEDVPIPEPSNAGGYLGALERADAEDAIGDLLDGLGVDGAWELSGTLVDAGFTVEDLAAVPAGHAKEVIALAAAEADLATLVSEVREGASRLSELVSALKSYSFLDQAPVQEVDVVKGIRDTLLILKPKTKDISIELDFPDDLPRITAYGSQLNQVWTNLIDNAADAIHASGVEPAWIRLAARHEDDAIIVTVANPGPPIPDDVIDRIFEAFFTTKEPGKGTGLGLDTAYSIVVTQHRGSLTVASDEDATVFTATLPIDQDVAGPQEAS